MFKICFQRIYCSHHVIIRTYDYFSQDILRKKLLNVRNKLIILETEFSICLASLTSVRKWDDFMVWYLGSLICKEGRLDQS